MSVHPYEIPQGYTEPIPIVAIRVRKPLSKEGWIDLDALLDTGASRATIPDWACLKLNLPYLGRATVRTGGGDVERDLYMAEVEFASQTHTKAVYASELLVDRPYNALVGRDMINIFTIMFSWKKRKIEISDP